MERNKYNICDGVLTFSSRITSLPAIPSSEHDKILVVDMGNCSNLLSLTFSDVYTSFRKFSKLNKVILPPNITEIEPETFLMCKYLSEVQLPPTVRAIRSQAFKWCDRLKTIGFNEGLEIIETEAFYACKALKSISLPSTLREIESSAFELCCRLREVIYNGSIPNVEEDAFAFDDDIEYVHKGVNLSDFKPQNWDQVEAMIKQDPLQFKQLDLSGCSIKELPVGAFDGCLELEELILPDGLKKIDQAFDNCPKLKTLNIPNSVVYLEQDFSTCGIQELKLPAGIRTVACSDLNVLDLTDCKHISEMRITATKVVYLPLNSERITDGTIGMVDFCFAPSTLKHIGVLNEVGIICSSANLSFSECISDCILFVPAENVSQMTSKANASGLTQNELNVVSILGLLSTLTGVKHNSSDISSEDALEEIKHLVSKPITVHDIEGADEYTDNTVDIDDNDVEDDDNDDDDDDDYCDDDDTDYGIYGCEIDDDDFNYDDDNDDNDDSDNYNDRVTYSNVPKPDPVLKNPALNSTNTNPDFKELGANALKEFGSNLKNICNLWFDALKKKYTPINKISDFFNKIFQ